MIKITIFNYLQIIKKIIYLWRVPPPHKSQPRLEAPPFLLPCLGFSFSGSGGLSLKQRPVENSPKPLLTLITPVT